MFENSTTPADQILLECEVTLHHEINSLGMPSGGEPGRIAVTERAILIRWDSDRGPIDGGLSYGSIYRPAIRTYRLGLGSGMVFGYLEFSKAGESPLFIQPGGLNGPDPMATAQRLHAVAADQWNRYQEERRLRPPLVWLPPMPLQIVHQQIERYLQWSNLRWGNGPRLIRGHGSGQFGHGYAITLAGLPVDISVRPYGNGLGVEAAVTVLTGIDPGLATENSLQTMTEIDGEQATFVQLRQLRGHWNLVVAQVVSAHTLNLVDLEFAVKSAVNRGIAAKSLGSALGGVDVSEDLRRQGMQVVASEEKLELDPQAAAGSLLPPRSEQTFQRLRTSVEVRGEFVETDDRKDGSGVMLAGQLFLCLSQGSIPAAIITHVLGQVDNARISKALTWEILTRFDGAFLALRPNADGRSSDLIRRTSAVLHERGRGSLDSASHALSAEVHGLPELRHRLGLPAGP